MRKIVQLASSFTWKTISLPTMGSTQAFPTPSLFYAGKPQKATSGRSFQTFEPSTAKPLADVGIASTDDLEAAVAAAKKAFPVWSKKSPVERSKVLLQAAKLLRERNDEIAKVETLDTGKAYSETSTVDVFTGADVLEYYAHYVASGGLNGEQIPLREDAWAFTKKEPLGVCAGIGAWNYPIQIALWKSAPCLAAGNTMVYKPSEFTPLHGVILAQIYKEAGLPDGAFNVVHGAGEVGGFLTQHPEIAKVSFTGQISTGMKVAGAAAGNMKYVTMELGGKSPLIILEDAELENAVDAAMMANFYSTGQVCTNGTRVFVPASMKESFEKRLVEKMQYIRMGDLFDMSVNMGPLSSAAHLQKVRSYIEHGIKQDKARVLYGGLEKPNVPAALKDGYWVTPTIFTDCTDDMKVVQEEIFGPVMSVLYYNTVDEAVARANNTKAGLAAGVVGTNINIANKVAAQLEAGITWVNTWGESPAEMPVGGWKHSGVGVENGHKGIEAWVRNKSTLIENGGAIGTVFSKL